MIILEGTITNKIITGTNGDFSVGSFNTEIGQFKIKSQLLDQFEEGDYQVRVSVTKLSLNTYVVRRSGITITEIVADIDAIDVIDADIKQIVDEGIEQDASVDDVSDKVEQKADDKEVPKKSVKPENDKAVKIKKAETSTSVDSDNDESLAAAELFGLLWPIGESVKLDTTLPRAIFIKQKEYLYDRGFAFDLKTQIWSR